MKKTITYLLTTFFLSTGIHSQEKYNKPAELYYNNINGYIGLFEFNINYERNIIQHSKLQTNLRMGIGLGAFETATAGLYLNPSIVQLIGHKKSFLEIDLGFKYLLTESSLDPNYSKFFVSDIFLGYRFENPGNKRIFRVGFNYPTLINIGVGSKF